MLKNNLFGWQTRKKIFPYALMLPAIVIIFTIIIYPIFRGIFLSFTDKFLTERAYNLVGVYQYLRLFKDPDFWQALKNSIIWSIIGVGGQLLVGFGMAYLLTRRLKGEKIFRAFFLIPWTIATISTSIIFMWLYNPMYGFLNYYAKLLGLHGKILFLANTKLALLSVSIPLIWRAFPFVMLVFIAGIESLEEEVFEAASVDGATAWHKFRYITLPLLRPIIKLMAIILFLWTFTSFDFVWVMTKGGPGGATQLLSTLSYHYAIRSSNLGYGSAIGVVIFIVLVIVSIFYIRSLRRD
ncbi:MAG: sugar ABC transporter permease [Actinobacteria bacterium]|nr:sugar ABC transporter permease [Actinomycetota bacterium]MCL5070147.1 sugar ABC transporter permease [Actinomycetota bacterium]